MFSHMMWKLNFKKILRGFWRWRKHGGLLPWPPGRQRIQFQPFFSAHPCRPKETGKLDPPCRIWEPRGEGVLGGGIHQDAQAWETGPQPVGFQGKALMSGSQETWVPSSRLCSPWFPWSSSVQYITVLSSLPEAQLTRLILSKLHTAEFLFPLYGWVNWGPEGLTTCSGPTTSRSLNSTLRCDSSALIVRVLAGVRGCSRHLCSPSWDLLSVSTAQCARPLHLNSVKRRRRWAVTHDSLQPHGLQHARLPCPSLSPGVCSNACLLSWCQRTISPSVTCFSSCPQSLPASGSFPMSWLFTSGGQRTGASASASVLPVSIQSWFPLGWTGWISLQSKGLSRVFSSTTVQKHQPFSAQSSLYGSQKSDTT